MNFPLSKFFRFFNNNKAPRKCYAFKYIYDPYYSFYILGDKCDCNIWCKFPPTTKFKKL